MKIRKGDRFMDNHHYSVWEVTHEDHLGCCWGICVECGTSGAKSGEKDWWGFDNTTAWRYLGNFSKSNNFNSLYNKLNESSY